MKFDVQARLAARPTISYDEALPVTQKRAEIAEAISKHQVVVVWQDHATAQDLP